MNFINSWNMAIILIFGLTSCADVQNTADSNQKSAKQGWSDEDMLAFQSACVDQATNSLGGKANIWCGCMGVEISNRTTYQNVTLQGLLKTVMDAINDGTATQCYDKVGLGMWSFDELSTMRTNCIDTATQLYPEIADANINLYCGCIVEKTSKRWSFLDFAQHEFAYTDLLTRDGTIKSCQEIGSIKTTESSVESTEPLLNTDTKSPTIWLESTSPALINQNNLTLTVNSDEAIRNPYCMLDNSYRLSCTQDSSSNNLTVSASSLADGIHSIKIYAYDTSNNQSNQLSVSFTVDTTLPAFNLTTKPSTALIVTETEPCFHFEWTKSTDVTKLTVIYNESDPYEIDIEDTGIYLCEISDGNQSATFRAYDQAGNIRERIYNWSFQFRFQRYEIGNQVTIKDTVQRLMITTVQGPDKRQTASTSCNNLTFAGLTGWSLPSSAASLKAMAENNIAAFVSESEIPNAPLWTTENENSTSSGTSCNLGNGYPKYYSYWAKAVNLRLLINSSERYLHTEITGYCGTSSTTTTYNESRFVCIRAY